MFRIHRLVGDVLGKEDITNKDRFVDEADIKLFRRCIGQLGWLSTISKPEASYMHCILSTVQARPQVSDFLKFRKIVTELKTAGSKIMLSKLESS